MEDGIFSLAKTNPNHAVMIVPQEFGGADDDNYFGSIGDATQKHVGSLAHGERQLWEGLYVSPNGKVFRTEDSPAWHDPDPFSLSGEDLEEYFDKLKVTMKGRGEDPSSLAALREAIEQEQERREKSEDMFDHAEPIPYHMLQYYPGQSKHAEIPSTPISKMAFMGNTHQHFYDFFCEEHPDAGLINQCIQMLNKPDEKLDEGYLEWFKLWLHNQPGRQETKANFAWLADQLLLSKEDPIELTERVLIGIENVWRKDYQAKANEKQSKDSILQLLKINEQKWAAEAKKGVAVYANIKKFGQLLFKEFKGQMKKHHWGVYKRIKTQYAPRVMVRGVDINKANLDQLKSLFKDKARSIWTARPFESLVAFHEAGFLTKEVFADNNQAVQILQTMEQKLQEGQEAFNSFRRELIEAQKKKVYGMMNWSPIWSYYHLLKAEQSEEQDNGR